MKKSPDTIIFLVRLFDELHQKSSAFAAYYQKVIDMKRKASRVYIIHAHGEQSKQFDFKTGDTLAYNEKIPFVT